MSAHDQEPSPKQAVPAVSRAKVIERLLNVDSLQACTQTEPEVFPVHQQDSNAKQASLLAEIEGSLPFPMEWLSPTMWSELQTSLGLLALHCKPLSICPMWNLLKNRSKIPV